MFKPRPQLAFLAALAALAALALGAGVLQAAPAPWYYWQHPTQPSPVCAQLAPGPGWEQISAPFAGPGCQRPLRARMP